MFFGQKELTIDDKSRLVLPSIYREGFQGGECYATLGLDMCIELYPKDIFEKKVAEIMKLPEFSKEARDLRRTLLGNTFCISIDSHNRILIPKILSDKTKTGKKVIAVGIFDRLQIWDADLYRDRQTESENNYDTNARYLLEAHHGV